MEKEHILEKFKLKCNEFKLKFFEKQLKFAQIKYL